MFINRAKKSILYTWILIILISTCVAPSEVTFRYISLYRGISLQDVLWDLIPFFTKSFLMSLLVELSIEKRWVQSDFRQPKD